MITREDDVDIHALHRQGWTITAIARHVGRDRKTVRDYLNGKREPGVRKRALIRSRRSGLCDREVGRGSASVGDRTFDELQAFGLQAWYPTLTREIRARRLRPVCADCTGATGRVNAVIAHPAGEARRASRRRSRGSSGPA